jgi:hypothetical protein
MLFSRGGNSAYRATSMALIYRPGNSSGVKGAIARALSLVTVSHLGQSATMWLSSLYAKQTWRRLLGQGALYAPLF